MATKTKGIYLVEFNLHNGKRGIKVGISDDCPRRMHSYRSPWCRTIIRIEYLPCQYPRLVERICINKFKEYSTERSEEFFKDLDFNILKETIFDNRFNTKPGILINRKLPIFSQWVVIEDYSSQFYLAPKAS